MRRHFLVTGLSCLLAVQASLGADAPARPYSGPARQAAGQVEPLEVELFAAIVNRQLDVGVVAHNYSLVSLLVRNRTARVVKVNLPKTFGAVPVDRWQAMQRTVASGGSLSNFNSGFGYDNGGSQGLGGSLAGPWMQPSLDHSAGSQVGQGGDTHERLAGREAGARDREGSRELDRRTKSDAKDEPANEGPVVDRPWEDSWTIAPRGVFRLQVPSFCLEYGKPDPSRRIAYTICPLEYVNRKPALGELMQRFGKGDWDQRIAQLAAWHVANGTPWQELARIKFPPMPGRSRTVTSIELLGAQKLVQSLAVPSGVPSLGSQ